MVRISVLNDALKNMYNAEKRGKRQVLVKPSSKVVIKFLQVMMKHGYIGEFELVDDHRGGKIVVELNGRLNKCGVISPRYDISNGDIEDWVGRLLPSRLVRSPRREVLRRSDGWLGGKGQEGATVSVARCMRGRCDRGTGGQMFSHCYAWRADDGFAPTVWQDCAHHLRWHYGPRGGSPQEDWRQGALPSHTLAMLLAPGENLFLARSGTEHRVRCSAEARWGKERDALVCCLRPVSGGVCRL
mmetsp:Transcript_53212/g.168963  ORF Transcript_53212/g.168963 Transcript_53212/m.168963 type:complete len:243 (+) Transcript_53212:78-806(+)